MLLCDYRSNGNSESIGVGIGVGIGIELSKDRPRFRYRCRPRKLVRSHRLFNPALLAVLHTPGCDLSALRARCSFKSLDGHYGEIISRWKAGSIFFGFRYTGAHQLVRSLRPSIPHNLDQPLDPEFLPLAVLSLG